MNGTFNIMSNAHKMGPNNNIAELAIDIAIAIDNTIPVCYVTSWWEHCRSTGECGEVGFCGIHPWIQTSSKPADAKPTYMLFT